LEAGEGTEAFGWAVHAVNFQNLSRLVPDDDVKAIDDPDDPMLPSPNRGCINGTSKGSNGDRASPGVVDLTSQPRAQMDDGAQVTCTNDLRRQLVITLPVQPNNRSKVCPLTSLSQA
jgi:hypothetical protein